MISEFHAHIYFELDQAALAGQVRLQLAATIPELTYVGQLIPKPVGPHPKPMFEIHIPAAVLDDAILKIEVLQGPFDVLIHPVHNNHLIAHTKEARWLGSTLPLNVAFFDSL